jgi:biotin-dependent carboxylase-like uncharacterized protein
MPAVIPLGERALRVSLPDVDAVLAVYDAFRRDPLPGQVDLVPGAESLVVQCAGPASAELAREVGARAQAELAQRGAFSLDMVPDDAAKPDGVPSGSAPSVAGPTGMVRIDTVYQGQDLARVAELIGLSIDGVVAAHTGATWRVAFCGFAPGFAYLSGGDPRLVVPRRAEPRSEVPSGAVGLAGEYSGVYPRPSPGGWQLIGRTDAAMWDAQRDRPALLRPGMSVTFRAVRPSMTLQRGMSLQPGMTLQQASPPPRREAKIDDAPPIANRHLAVLRPGLHCVVQDLGRVGYADMGVSPSGAADRTALLCANRAVGNAPDAAALEVLLGGADFEAGADLVVALAGAPVEVLVTAQPRTASYQKVSHAMGRPLALAAGSRLRLGRPARGLRTYVAVRGGIDLPPVLGSRSTDVLAELGPAPVRSGDVLPVGPAGTRPVGDAAAATGDSGDNREGLGADAALAILPGPQRDWFTDAAWELLEAASWAVTPATNRVAARLSGPHLPRAVTSELPSQGLVRGAIQVPPSGALVAFLADHPVTGGYPVIAVLSEAAADRLAQCRPGSSVLFRDPRAP